MTEAPVTPPSSVASPPEAPVPTVPRRVVGGDAEAALRERNLKARGETLLFELRGVEYRILTPVPAAVVIHAGLVQSGEDGDMGELLNAIRSAFVGDDGDDLVKALLDTKVDIPADFAYINDMLNAIVEAASGRPSTSSTS